MELLSIVLPHTELALTEHALREAARMADGLHARIDLLAIREIPYPRPLDPSVGYPGFPELVEMAEAVGAPVTIHVIYGRDWATACEEWITKSSVVVIGARKGWLRSREEKMAARLERAGHKVTLVKV